MAKLILFSILVATLAVPIRAARDPSPARGLGRAVLWLVALHTLYLVAIVYVYPRLL